MIRTDLERIRDARRHADHALILATALGHPQLASDQVARQSILFDLVVIGAAVGKIPADLRGLAPHIPWREIVGLRNVIVHAYWQIDWETVAGVLRDDLPDLLSALDVMENAIGQET